MKRLQKKIDIVKTDSCDLDSITVLGVDRLMIEYLSDNERLVVPARVSYVLPNCSPQLYHKTSILKRECSRAWGCGVWSCLKYNSIMVKTASLFGDISYNFIQMSVN